MGPGSDPFMGRDTFEGEGAGHCRVDGGPDRCEGAIFRRKGRTRACQTWPTWPGMSDNTADGVHSGATW